MYYHDEIEFVKESIKDLKNIMGFLHEMEDAVYAIEKNIAEIDESLPDEETLAAMKEDDYKKEILELIEQMKEAYQLIDDILGEPEEGPEEGPEEAADGGTLHFDEENSNLSVLNIMKMLPKGKHNAS